MSEETKGPDLGDAAKKKAQELNQAVQKLGLHDRLIFLGAAAALLFWLLPWFTVNAFGMGQSTSGMHNKYLIGWFAGLATLLLCLVNMRLVPVAQAAAPARNPVTYLVTTGLMILFGPFLFMLDLPEYPSFGDADGMFSIGKTIWFWLAFGACLAAAAGAVLKFLATRQSSPPA